MADMTPELAGEVVTACKAAVDEIVAALNRAFEGPPIGVEVGDVSLHDAANPLLGFEGPGLAVVLTFGEVGALVLLPESSGLVPEWYGNDDPTTKSKLATLAQELGMLLVPESVMADDFRACRVDHLGEALLLAEVAEATAHVPLALKRDDQQGQFSFIWPVAKPQSVKAAPPAAKAEPKVESPAAASPPPLPQPAMQSEPAAVDDGESEDYPYHMRSFLKIEVPLSVQLAHQKQTVQDILSLVPGAIIKFDKSCDEMLDLMVGDQPIAEGEVVKIGDKFGLRIRSMTMPQEKFIAVKVAMP
jgi:flagellar motor switch protein FliN/FliY